MCKHQRETEVTEIHGWDLEARLRKSYKKKVRYCSETLELCEDILNCQNLEEEND